MKNILTLLLCLCFINASFAQSNFVVERIQLASTLDEGNKSFVPRLKDNKNPKSPVVAKVNQYILDRFEITSFDQKELEEFRWSDLDFRHEILDNLLFISSSGEYYAAYPNYVEEELFFDLTTGELLKNSDIPFQALFSLKGYFDFMNKRWLSGVKPAFKEALECSDSAELFCSYYDITEYSYAPNKSFTCSLETDCYPRALLACAPGHSITLTNDSITQYLSDFGKNVLITRQYSQLKGVKKYQFNKSIESQIPDNVFVVGKIGDKYDFSMAFQLNRSTHKATGYYYYERKKIPITLTGTATPASIQLEESSKGQVTGRMSLTLHTNYEENGLAVYEGGSFDNAVYVTGNWASPDGKTNMNITITEIKISNRIR
ncbi:MAG TPA: hypothetical protein VGK59_21375 [Ohtaekwangia sp.]